MNIVLIILLLIIAAGLMAWGIQQKQKASLIFGVLISGSIFLVMSFLNLRSDALWFDSMGYSEHFHEIVLYRLLFAVLGGVIGFSVLWFLTLFVFAHKKPRYRWMSTILGFYFGAKWGGLNWGTILLYLNRTKAGIEDPILHKDAGFYLFTLPFYDRLYGLFLGLSVIGLLSVLAGLFLRFQDGHVDFKMPTLDHEKPAGPIRWVHVNIASLLFVLAWGQYLNCFHLFYAHDGVLFGAGWADVHIKLPALLTVMIALSAGAVLQLVPGLRKLIKSFLAGGYSIPSKFNPSSEIPKWHQHP